MLDLHEASHDFVGLKGLAAPDSGCEGTGAHPDVVFEGVFV